MTDDSLFLPAGAPPRRGWPLLVGLHGFAEDGARLAARLGLDDAPFACLWPSAPGGSWYAYDGDQEAFARELERGAEDLERRIRELVAGAPLDAARVALLGYSQGGYLAGYTALREPDRWRGLVAVSCRLKTELLDLAPARGFPVLIVHGTRDRSVRLAPQQAAAEELEAAGVDVRWHLHDRGHGLPRSCVPAVKEFVSRVLEVDSLPE